MVTGRDRHSSETRSKQASNEVRPIPDPIGLLRRLASSPRNLSPRGGLVPVVTRLDEIGCRKLVAETVTVERAAGVVSTYWGFASAWHGSIRCCATGQGYMEPIGIT